MEYKISPELIAFLQFQIPKARDKDIFSSTQLEEELWLCGDEAAEFLDRFSHQFGVDISDFDFEKYFSPEPGLNYIFNKIGSMLFPRSKNKKNSILTVGDLEKGIQSKVLI